MYRTCSSPTLRQSNTWHPLEPHEAVSLSSITLKPKKMFHFPFLKAGASVHLPSYAPTYSEVFNITEKAGCCHKGV